jgi:hypothetical protein
MTYSNMTEAKLHCQDLVQEKCNGMKRLSEGKSRTDTKFQGNRDTFGKGGKYSVRRYRAAELRHKKRCHLLRGDTLLIFGVPNRIRTGVVGVKGRCPGPG